MYSPDAGVLNATKSCAMFQRLAAENGAVLQDRTVSASLPVACCLRLTPWLVTMQSYT